MSQAPDKAKEVRAIFARAPVASVEIKASDKTSMSDAYEGSGWSIIHRFTDGGILITNWSGYTAGYSEYTPSSPGSISFRYYEPGEKIPSWEEI